MSSAPPSPSAHWEAYWNAAAGQRAAVSGDAPGDLFDEVWRGFLANALAGRAAPRLLDLACGAGVLLDRALEAAAPGQTAHFTGLDYAASAAVAVACKPAPDNVGVHGIAASAAQLPIADGAFDIVISQFGIEYAGRDAFDEAARILAPGGVLQFILHHKNGGIDRECSENARVLDAVLSSGLFETAIEAIRGPDHDGAVAKLKTVFAALKPCLDGDPVAAKQMLGRLLTDVAQLVSRREAFNPTEAISWCESMRVEVALYEGRMHAMTQCALDSEGVVEARARLAKSGTVIVSPPEVLTPKGKTMPAAWRLNAKRPA